MSAEQDTCLECGTVIPEGTDRCPGCQLQLAFCAQDACMKPFPAGEAFCPFCGTPNPVAEPPAPKPAPPVIPKPSPAPPTLVMPSTPQAAPPPAVPTAPDPFGAFPMAGGPLQAAGSGPVVVETQLSQPPRQGRQSILRVRVSAPGFT